MNSEEERRLRSYLFGERLAYLRKGIGLSRGDVALRLGIPESTVKGIEAGSVSLDAENLPIYAHALGVDTVILCSMLDEVERTWRDV